jgi:hypothetical protein
MLRPRVALPTTLGATLEPLVEALATPSSLPGGAIRIGRGAILALGSGVVRLAVIVPAISLGGLGGGVPATGSVLHVAWRTALHMLTGATIGLPNGAVRLAQLCRGSGWDTAQAIPWPPCFRGP